LRSVLRWFRAAPYRLGQFLRACSGGGPGEEAERALSVLSPRARELFLRQAAADQRHALAVHELLVADGHTAPELLQAALLHDIGKTAGSAPLLARGLMVVARALWPALAERLGRPPAEGWRRAFVVLSRHPEEGARMAGEAGCSPLTVALIRRHERELLGIRTEEDRLLAELQAADAKS
jgi:hypothetical protein